MDAGVQQLPPLIAPPSAVNRDSFFTPAPAPSQTGGGATTTPKPSIVPSSGSVSGLPPTNSPGGGLSNASPSVNLSPGFPVA
ncbi:hypothetical protein U1Q18_017751, partial [Sarracenia purpurea var. burkii]